MNFDLRNNMKEYLESTKSGMQVLLASAPAQTDAERANMDTCRAMIEEIDGLVEKTIDVVSPAAVEKYNDMMINLHKWRNNLARSGGLYDATTVELLRKVLNAARAWGTLYIASGRPAKISDVIAVPIDDLTRTVESEGVRQNVEMFLTRCEAYAQETAGMRNNGTHEQITLRREKLKTIAAREQEIVVQFRNGDLAREDAEYELQNLKDEKDFLNYEIERLEGDRVSREEVQLRRNMILKIERPIRTAYNHVRRNRLHVHAVFNGIDFARMIAMINNNVSASQLEAGVADLETLLLARGVIDKQGQVSLEGVTKITAEVDQLNEELLGTAPKTATPTEGEGSLLDQLLASTATPASGSTIPTGTTGDTHRTGRRTEDIID